jgi:uncharacterized phage-associated protein
MAKYVIAFFLNKGDLITNKKLQKLLYYIQAWNLVYFDDQLLDETPEAWVHEPVYPSVYREFKRFGVKPLLIEDIDYGDWEDGKLDQAVSNYEKQLDLSDKRMKLIKTVLLKYGSLSAYQLEVLTHKEEPWTEQRIGLTEFESCNNTISFDSMKKYYKTKLEA